MSYADIQSKYGSQIEKFKKQQALKQKEIISDNDDILSQLTNQQPIPVAACLDTSTQALAKLAQQQYTTELKSEKLRVAIKPDGWFSFSPMILTANQKDMADRALKNLAIRTIQDHVEAEEAKQLLINLESTFKTLEHTLELKIVDLNVQKDNVAKAHIQIDEIETALKHFSDTVQTLHTQLQTLDPSLELPETRNWHSIKNILEYLTLKNDSLVSAKQAITGHSELESAFESYLTERNQQDNLSQSLHHAKTELALTTQELNLAEQAVEKAVTRVKQAVEQIEHAENAIIEDFKLDTIESLDHHIAMKDILSQMYLNGSSDLKRVVMPTALAYSCTPEIGMPHYEVQPDPTPLPPPKPVVEYEHLKPHFD